MTTRLGSGRGTLVGHGIPHPVPITLDPAAYAGALVYGADGQFYQSNGVVWSEAGALAQTYNTTTPNTTVPVLLLEPGASRSEASVDVALSPRGIGAFLADVPDNTTAGGNKRGHNAVDLQRTRGAATHVASGDNSVIGGGIQNTASGTRATVAGGEGGSATQAWATVGGGFINTASGVHSTVGGGNNNIASASRATVAGGEINLASGGFSAVGGGRNNTASNDDAVIGGGFSHEATGLSATIAGGRNNTASGGFAAIAGGENNTASGDYPTVSGGSNNTATTRAVVGGGAENTANGIYSAIPGGLGGRTRGLWGRLSFSAGYFTATGDAQYGLQPVRRETTDATATTLTATAAAASASNITVLPARSLHAFSARVACIQTGGTAGTAGDSKAWTVQGSIKRGANAAATALLGTPTITVLGADTALGADNATGATIAIAANTTLGGLVINVTGQANKNLRWVATIETTEVAY